LHLFLIVEGGGERVGQSSRTWGGCPGLVNELIQYLYHTQSEYDHKK